MPAADVKHHTNVGWARIPDEFEQIRNRCFEDKFDPGLGAKKPDAEVGFRYMIDRFQARLIPFRGAVLVSDAERFCVVGNADIRYVRTQDKNAFPLTGSLAKSLERTRQAEYVFGDVGQDQVGRDRRHQVQASFPELALDVVLRGEAEAAVGLDADIGRFP